MFPMPRLPVSRARVRRECGHAIAFHPVAPNIAAFTFATVSPASAGSSQYPPPRADAVWQMAVRAIERLAADRRARCAVGRTSCAWGRWSIAHAPVERARADAEQRIGSGTAQSRSARSGGGSSRRILSGFTSPPSRLEREYRAPSAGGPAFRCRRWPDPRSPGQAQGSSCGAPAGQAAHWPWAHYSGAWHTASTLLPSGSRTNAP
jgi:hypothetical protein